MLWLYTRCSSQSQEPRLDDRIVGGEPANIEDFPYQVYIEINIAIITLACGGCIVTPIFVITAGHCAYGFLPPTMTVRAGSSFKGSGGQTVIVRSSAVHPLYIPLSNDYDIAVLRLTSALKLGPGIYPIRLPNVNEECPPGTEVVVSGWGTLTEGGSTSEQLQAVAVFIVDQEECNVAYNGTITNRMICAGVPEGGKDSCQGDSGGPLRCFGKLGGVVSSGEGCARPGYPGIYTRVANHAIRSFIRRIIGI